MIAAWRAAEQADPRVPRNPGTENRSEPIRHDQTGTCDLIVTRPWKQGSPGKGLRYNYRSPFFSRGLVVQESEDF